MKLAANLSWLYTEFEFPDRLKACAEDGFRHAECMFPYEHQPELLRQRAEEAGVEWVLINAPAGDWSGGDRGLATSPARRDEFRQAASQAARYAEVLGVGKVHVLAGVVDLADAKALNEAWQCYEQNLRWLSEEMQCLPIDWLIEPINRFDVPGYLLTTQAEAHALIERLGCGNLGVQMDLYHCQRVEGHALDALARYLPTGRVRHLQIAGVPHRNEPQTESQDAIQEVGLDYWRVREQLQQMDYRGHIGCEYRPRGATRDGLGWIQSTGFSGTMESFKPKA